MARGYRVDAQSSPFCHLSTKPTLSLPNQPNSVSTNTWSARITERYHVRLSEELARWFDDELWRKEGNGEYREPIPPSDLIETFPEAIWPGLMPPDFLPLLGNMAGDWLCMRIGAMGEVVEIVQWYHGGGDWLPWGKTLAEAIVFDAVSPWLPGPSRRHAIPAEPMRGSQLMVSDPLLNWATSELPSEIAAMIADAHANCGEQFVKQLMGHGIAEVALQSEWVQRLMSDAHASKLDANAGLAERLGVSRQQLNEWFFDFEFMPAEIRAKVLDDRHPHQDWDAVADHCRRVTQIAPHLAWGWDLLGYAQTRAGRFVDAASCFAHGMTKSVFTDQSIRLRTHWKVHQAGKFSAAMLRELIEAGRVSTSDITVEFDTSYLDALCAAEDVRQELVTQYWLKRSEQSSAAGNHTSAFDEAYAAGWDLGAATLPAYGSVLDRLVEIAEAGGDAARAELARTHRRCLHDRLGI